MKKHLAGILFLLVSVVSLNGLSVTGYADNPALIKQADQLWEEKSYHMAAQQYRAILKEKGLPEKRLDEVNFKLADCLWRAGGTGRIKDAEKILKELLDSKDHDRWWAEANESLAEYYLQKDRWSHQNEIKEYLENARDFWAGATDVKLARKRFIHASFTFGDYLSQNWGWYYTGIKPTRYSDVRIVPPKGGVPTGGLDILYKEILKVAKSDKDKAKAHYSLAMSYQNRAYNDKDKKLVEKNFKKVIEKYPSTEWLDDSYYYLGQFYERSNEFKKALKSYQGLLSHFRKGESQWVDDAQRRVKDITEPNLQLSVGYTFLPDSEIQFNLRWRNVDRVNMTLYKLDLVKELQLNFSKRETDGEYGIQQYSSLLKQLVESNGYANLPIALSWKQKIKNEGKHIWHSANKGLAEWRQTEDKEEVDPKKGTLAAGAYLLLASGGGGKAYDLVLVTDMGLVTKLAGHSALFYTFDSKTGQPREDVRVKYHYRYYDARGHWAWEEARGVTDASGLLKVRLRTSEHRNYNNQHNIFTVVSDGTMQAFAQGNYYDYRGGKGNWWLYAFSDRPAYRPNEEVSFKGILRKYDGTHFTNPDGMRIKARIYDPRGNQVKEKVYTLNSFGSFHDTLTLDEKAPLGEYRIEVRTEDQNRQIATTTLFRLEEYKLPEFLVTIKPKPKDKEKAISTFRIGDTVQVELDAQYYFGGAVANADVEYLIYQNTYNHVYYPKKEYPWYYQDMRTQYYGYGHGQLVKKENVKTDEEGKAVFEFETPEDATYDLKYHIEARVVDQSRREIRASADIKVTQHSFYAYLTPKQNLYRPGDKAEVEIKTITANEDPVSVEGKVSVSRNSWQDPIIKEGTVTRAAHYSGNELFTKFVKTDDKGQTSFEFQPEQDGFYVVQFTGFDTDGSEITATTNVYVCSKQATDIGYRYSGLQIIAEKDTYKIGDTARMMLVADRPGTWVLLSAEAGEIYDYELHHLEGPVKLIEMTVTDAYTPNVFFNAVSANHYQLKTHDLAIIVPPEEKFLNVKIISDKEVYQPREEGQFEIEVTDNNGNPVVGEVAIGLVDKSVYYIQSDYAKDIREYFYGDKRNHSVQTQASFNRRQYMRLVRGDEDQLITEAENERRNRMKGDKIVDLLSVIPSNGEDRFGGSFKDARFDADESMALGAVGARLEEKAMSSNRGLPSSSAPRQVKKAMLKQKGRGGEAGEDLETPEVRTDFRSTVFWQPTVVTDENGKAVITTTFPDSLTTWKTTARVITTGTTVGNITHEVRTKKDVIVRLQAPRFFTERDKVTISANVHNYTDKEQKIKVTIDAQGLQVLDKDKESVWVTVPSQGEERVDWICLTPKAGKAEITVMAQAKTASDAMKRAFPIIPHGIEKFIANALVLKGDDAESQQSEEFTIQVPEERIKESTSLQLVLSPSMAAAMLDALPYLADYPYGCVEQTMSRFLPSVIVAKTMRDLGLSEEQVMGYISDVLEPRGDPKGHPKRKTETTVTKLKKITRDGLKRLYDFQHSDGGWGWWKEGDSDRFMSAYVVWGLGLARKAGIKVKSGVISRGATYLQKELVEEENNPDMLAWMLHALSTIQRYGDMDKKLSDRLWQKRDELNPYTRALFALSEMNRGNREKADVLARNLANGIQEDSENSTAHWGESGVHYRFSEGGVEATAFCIKALSNIDPQSAYLEPAVKWMALNRRGARWKNTRDTAIAILGLADYLKTTNELNPDYQYEVFVNGKQVRKGKVNARNLFTFNRIVNLPNDALHDGENQVKVTFKGRGALYLAGYLKYFTLEEDITPEGNEVFVKRQFFHETQKETLLKGYVADWAPLKNGDKIKSGERVRVEITLDAKNHYEYLVVEDYKPAGFEAVELKSGSVYALVLDEDGHETGQTTWVYRELRDQKVVFFITKLPQGKHKIIYELRAEIPGEFHGMPNQTHAMYVPEIRANSAEVRLEILER